MRKTVVVIECERCHREERLEPDAKQESRKVIFQLGDQKPTVLYEDLCAPCHAVILNCLEMMKPTDKKSPIRVKPRGSKKDKEPAANGVTNGTAPPSPPAPPATTTPSALPHAHPSHARSPRG